MTTAPPETPEIKATPFDVQTIRRDFPILAQTVYDKPLVYLDNAATSQKPQTVIDALNDYYTTYNSNVHRGVHNLSERATDAYEQVREKVRGFINAGSVNEIIFVRGTTEGLNLVAQTYGRTNLGDGDEVLISKLEHHSNIVPWQIVCDQTGAQLRVAPINDRGELIVDEFTKLLTNKTRVVAFNHVSNSLGTINPAKELIVKAHEAGAVVVIDGAQAAPHMRVDVRDLDADFYAFSGHKAFGPTGIGALYGKPELLEAMPPYQGGGDMIKSVTFEKTVYNDIPYRFEAGTPNIADTIGLGAAIDYLASIDFDGAVAHEHDLLVYGTQALESIDGLRLIGTAGKKASVLSFVLKGIHPYDASPVLDHQGVAVRTGHHCTQPVMDHFGIPSTFRASLAFYNTKEEIDALAKALEKVKKMFA